VSVLTPDATTVTSEVEEADISLVAPVGPMILDTADSLVGDTCASLIGDATPSLDELDEDGLED